MEPVEEGRTTGSLGGELPLETHTKNNLDQGCQTCGQQGAQLCTAGRLCHCENYRKTINCISIKVDAIPDQSTGGRQVSGVDDP